MVVTSDNHLNKENYGKLSILLFSLPSSPYAMRSTILPCLSTGLILSIVQSKQDNNLLPGLINIIVMNKPGRDQKAKHISCIATTSKQIISISRL